MYRIKTLQNTILKRRPVQSADLAKGEGYPVREGQIWRLAAYIEDVDTDHIKFTLLSATLGGFNTWYAYKPHVELLEEDTPRNGEAAPTVSFNPQFKEQHRGSRLALPRIGTVYSNDRIGKSENFFWYEATHGGTRIPTTAEQVGNIIRIAEAAQVARDKLGKPFILTSWFRPEPFNSRAGGSRYSRHLVGDAIDFYVEGMSTYELYKTFDPWWKGGLGKYAGMAITHLDARGFAARWLH